ncbi:MAG: NAD-dependent deacylase [Desulfoplanes sp.]
MDDAKSARAASMIRGAQHVTVFTGAGISVESGIPPFRGDEGLWARYDPQCLDISFFHAYPTQAWENIREIFYDFMGKARPNAAHLDLARLEKKGMVKAVITQNIDNLHSEAGSRNLCEYHGTIRTLTCTGCGHEIPAAGVSLEHLPPRCALCGSVLKPDFVFFGELISEDAARFAIEQTHLADVMLVVGTTGEVMPACLIPQLAKENGCTIVEVNTCPSAYTTTITDVFLQGRATQVLDRLVRDIDRIKEKD